MSEMKLQSSWLHLQSCLPDLRSRWQHLLKSWRQTKSLGRRNEEGRRKILILETKDSGSTFLLAEFYKAFHVKAFL